MSKPISLFSGYSQKENRVTNYCLLIMKMLYEENPKYLGEVLEVLCGMDIGNHVGVSFRQQQRKAASVPDGMVIQKPFAIYIETKNYHWFYDKQLEKHLEALADEVGVKILLALGKFESDSDLADFDRVRRICGEKYRNEIHFRAISFEDFVGALEISGLPKNLADAVADFRDFLNTEGDLLPTWRKILDVVNCAGQPEDITKYGVYMSPAEGSSYSHQRARFFGMYQEKRVQLIAEIEAVVDVDLDADTVTLKWKNSQKSTSHYKQEAKTKVNELQRSKGATRIFLLGPLYKTDFKKDSRGGLFSPKLYFDISSLSPKDAEDLANKLNGKQWSDFR